MTTTVTVIELVVSNPTSTRTFEFGCNTVDSIANLRVGPHTLSFVARDSNGDIVGQSEPQTATIELANELLDIGTVVIRIGGQ